MLSLSSLRYIGRISYGLYVFHPLVFTILDQFEVVLSLPLVWQLLIKFGFTIVIAACSFHFFENWFLMLKDRITSPTCHRPQVPVATGLQTPE